MSLAVAELGIGHPGVTAGILGGYLARCREGIAGDPWRAAGKEPHEKQGKFVREALEGTADTLIHFGSARAGKSVGACLALLAYGYRWPCRILVGRYTFQDLDRSTMVSMGQALGWVFGQEWGHIRDIWGAVGKWEQQRRILTLEGGAQFEFQHFKDAGQLGSTEYGAAWIEEAQELPSGEGADEERALVSGVPEVITMIQSRLNKVVENVRWGRSIPRLLLTAMGWGHNWVYDMGIASPGPRSLVLESDAGDNAANIPEEWFERMRSLPEAEQKRYLFLSHDEFSGRVFTAFGPHNVRPSFPIPKSWPLIRGLDPGVTGAGWVWVSVATGVAGLREKGWPRLPVEIKDGDLVTWDEYGPQEVAVEDQVAHVRVLDATLTPIFTAIDPTDARQQTGSGLKTTKQLLMEMGIAPIRKSQNDETAFILQAQQDFTSRRHWILDNCKMLIRQLTDEAWDEKSRPGERKRRYSSRFHVLAAWKYAVMAKPEILVADPTPVRRGVYGTRSRTGY